MKKIVWIMNHYASQMYFDEGGRHYWFAKYLRRNGYKPVIFCCNTKHGVPEKYFETDNLYIVKESEEIETPFVFVNARTYSDNGKQRILNMMDFYQNVQKAAKKYAAKHGDPDIILASSVHPLTLIAGIQLAKYFHVKCICEIRDLWPEGLVPNLKKTWGINTLIQLLYQGEKWIYKKADALIFTFEGGPDYIRMKHWDKEHQGPVDMNKTYHICNGVDLEMFDYNRDHFRLEDADLDNPDIFKVVYAGSIRMVNNLGILLDAAKLIKDASIKILIFGDGDELVKLKTKVEDDRIQNVVFKGRINKKYIPSVVSRADLNLVHGKMTSAFAWGESINKSFEYFASGRPVFYTIVPGYSIVKKYECGILTDGFSPKDIAKGICDIKNMSEERRNIICQNARKAAVDYDFANLTKKLISIIESI